MSCTSCAVRHGTVDFSTMMAPGLACLATKAVTASNAAMLVAEPAPFPCPLVGVLTAMRTTSASLTHLATSVVNIKFGCLTVVFLIGTLVCPSR
jgi:MinD superfamily P-loop ATPase